MNDKTPSKADQLRAMRERKVHRDFLPPRKPNAFEDAARGRDPVPIPSQPVAPPKAPALKWQCPICAARRDKKAKAQKRWRAKKGTAK